MNDQIKKTIELSVFEQSICKYLAQRRFSKNRSSGVKNGKIGNQSNFYTDLNGVGAEFSFCKLFNIFPDLSISPRSGGYDCILNNGRKIDVKCTKYSFGSLLIKLGGLNVDYSYCLMIGEMPKYKFIGFIDGADVVNYKVEDFFGYGETYAVGQNNLKFDGLDD